MNDRESDGRRVSAKQALELCDREICSLINEGFGEKTIVLRANEHRITFAEVITAKKHKLN